MFGGLILALGLLTSDVVNDAFNSPVLQQQASAVMSRPETDTIPMPAVAAEQSHQQ